MAKGRDSQAFAGEKMMTAMKSKKLRMGYGILLGILLFVTCTPTSSAADDSGTIQLPRTGQTKCYNAAGTEITCAGTGQDGEYQAGVAWPEPRFTITYCDANGPCPEKGSDCDANASTDIVTDNLTGLMWTRDGNLPNTTYQWTPAVNFANELELCGYTDWRLPNVNELESLVSIAENQIATWLNGYAFTNVQRMDYWSSTTHAHYTGWGWSVNLDDGNNGVEYNAKGTYYRAWPVRGEANGPAKIWKTGQITSYTVGDDGYYQNGTDWSTPRFIDHGDETVTDDLTGLMWTKNADAPGPLSCIPTTQNWNNALTYIQCLNVAGYLGYNDWRLPNLKELLSLIDYSLDDRPVPPGHPFTSIQSASYWSSSTYAPNATKAWGVSMRYGEIVVPGKTGVYQLWPVRGGQVGPTPTEVSGTIDQNTTWTKANSPYIVNGSVTVSPGVTLTIKPGVVVKFLGTNLTVYGTLIADGTSDQPIYFTSLKDDSVGGDTNGDGSGSSPARGDWFSLYFALTSTNNLLNHVVVRYGGRFEYNSDPPFYRSLTIDTSSLTLSNSTVEESGGYGVWISGASPTITGNVIRDNGNIGVSLGSSDATVTNNTISGNGYSCQGGCYAMAVDMVSCGFKFSGNLISGNARNAVIVAGGTLAVSATWYNLNAPYVLTYPGITVPLGMTLTLEPGVVVKLDHTGFNVGGTVVANGTAEQPIVFTSVADDTVGGDTNGDGGGGSPARGDWFSLYFTSTSTNNLLNHVVVRYGGRFEYNSDPPFYRSLTIETSSLTLSNSTVEQSGGYGVWISGASPTITNNTIRGNGSYGVYNATNTIIVNAEGNYWGHSSGPNDQSDDRATGGWYNPNGQGDRVSDYVDYDPWLGYDPNIMLSGIVYDQSTRQPISGALVTLSSYSAVTNDNGYYAFDKISGGNYTMIVSKAGYFNYTTAVNLTTSINRDIFLPNPGTVPMEACQDTSETR